VLRRILVVALSAVALAVVLLGGPLAVAIERSVVAEERGELERTALQGAVTVSPTFRSGDPIELPAADAGIQLAVYTTEGRRVTGDGPSRLGADEVAAVRGGRVTTSTTSDMLAAAVPVSVGEHVIGVVRASSSRSAVRATVARDLLELAGLALLATVGAGALAYWQARRLARPMGRLADAAAQLGAGDFSVKTTPSGVAEIDRTADALRVTARRLSDLVERERAFAARASHQLRTPLTRLRLELEAGLESDPEGLKEATRDALATSEHLSQTLDDVLMLTREGDETAAPFDVEALLKECDAQWHGLFAAADRPLRLVLEHPPHALASAVAVRQVLHVLLDNAHRHGSGRVTLVGRETADAVAIDVLDHGNRAVTWPPERSSGHLGLVMARSLAESQRGRLLLSQDDGTTRFTLLLPAVRA
jgi:signal transduction histidine kinase